MARLLIGVILFAGSVVGPARNAEVRSSRWATEVVDCLAKPSNNGCNAHADCSEVLGPADGTSKTGYVSLGGGVGTAIPSDVAGFIVVRLGSHGAVDQPGPDLKVYEEGEPERYEVLVSDLPDGPFISLGIGSGTTEFDLATAGLLTAAYARIVDVNPAYFLSCYPGADIDAVEIYAKMIAGVDRRAPGALTYCQYFAIIELHSRS